MHEENRLLVYEKYSEILDGIFTYQDQQVDLREMCLKIMLGTFALTGGLLYVKVDVSNQLLLFMSALFPFLSLIIITINLLIDLVYKERLRLAFVSEAIRMEKEYKWLPRFHIVLLGEQKKKRLAASGQIVYYLGSAALLLLLSAVSLSIDPYFTGIKIKLFVLAFYFLVYVFYQFGMNKIVKRTETILDWVHNE